MTRFVAQKLLFVWLMQQRRLCVLSIQVCMRCSYFGYDTGGKQWEESWRLEEWRSCMWSYVGSEREEFFAFVVHFLTVNHSHSRGGEEACLLQGSLAGSHRDCCTQAQDCSVLVCCIWKNCYFLYISSPLLSSHLLIFLLSLCSYEQAKRVATDAAKERYNKLVANAKNYGLWATTITCSAKTKENNNHLGWCAHRLPWEVFLSSRFIVAQMINNPTREKLRLNALLLSLQRSSLC